jgi:putative peptide zinc metalloprotease protein
VALVLMQLGHLKFRDDLIVSNQDVRGEPRYIIKDPQTGRFFRFGQAEQFIAHQLNGSTALEVIQKGVEEEFGAAPGLESLSNFVEQLGRLGLLDGYGAASDRPAPPPRRIFGDILHLRLKAFDPDRLFDQLARNFRFFFTPHFLATSGGVILLGAGITITNWEAIQNDFYRLYSVQALFLGWLTVLVVTAIHEFAHGLTCKHFGRSVREVGFLLIYFQPAFYCNVSDAWLLPEKSKRLWVSFAGAYFELFLWATATLIWRVTDRNTDLNYITLVVMATSAIKSVFNLNPLIKLDGYYVLSDYLEIPNLRRRAFGYLRGLTHRWRQATAEGTRKMTLRERRIYLVYGLLAGSFSLALLSFFVFRLAGFLTRQYQAWGFILFVGLLVIAFRNPLKRMIPDVPTSLRRAQEMYRSMDRRIRIVAIFGVLAAILFLGRMELKVSGDFKVLPAYNAEIRAEVDGVIEETYVDEGDAVNKGDLIAVLSQRDLAPELQQVNAEINEKHAKLKMLQVGPRREEIAFAKKQVETAETAQEHALKRYNEAKRMYAERLSRAKSVLEKAEERLKYAKAAWQRAKSLLEEGLTSKKDSEEAEEQLAIREKEFEEAQAEHEIIADEELAQFSGSLAIAEKQLEEATSKLRMLLAGSRPEEIESTEAEISRLEAQGHYLQEQLQSTRIVSPIAGVIITRRLKEKGGQYARKGDLIAQVNELRTVTAETSIPEKEIADVMVGQRVVVKTRAYPETSFYGTVAAIAPTVTDKDPMKGEQTIFVTTVLPNESHLLKPEMTGTAKIYCGRRSIFHLLTRRLARYIRVEFWSWW